MCTCDCSILILDVSIYDLHFRMLSPIHCRANAHPANPHARLDPYVWVSGPSPNFSLHQSLLCLVNRRLCVDVHILNLERSVLNGVMLSVSMGLGGIKLQVATVLPLSKSVQTKFRG